MSANDHHELESLTRAYEASRLKSEIVLEAAGIGSFELDLVTGALDWDPRMQELFGYAVGEFTPHRDSGMQRVHPADRDSLKTSLGDAAADVGRYRSEFRVQLPNGSVRWLAARGRSVAGPDGRAALLVGTCYDITELRTARDRAAHLLETMSTGFIAIDRDWFVTYLNAEGARVIGHSAENLIGRSIWDAFPGLDDTVFGSEYRRAMATGETVELEAYYPHLEGWFAVRAVPSEEGMTQFFLEVTGRHRDQELAQAAARRLELLASVNDAFVDVGPDVDEAVHRLARLLVPELGDSAVVSLIDGDTVRDVASWHVDPALRPTLTSYLENRLVGRTQLGVVEQVRRTRKPVIVASGFGAAVAPSLGNDTARQALAELQVESAVIVPLMGRGDLVGVLTLVRCGSRQAANEDDVATAKEAAVRAGLALENARLHAEQISLAVGLQRSLLTTPPEPDHCQIAVRYVPAARVAEVGGDWYDAFLQPDGATVLVIGDVMGHDTSAAATMGQLRGLTRGIAWESNAGPAHVLRSLDAGMRGLQVETTATAVIARLEQAGSDRADGLRTLRWSNAGHPPPMALLPDGTVEVLDGGTPDLLLGLDPHSHRDDHTRRLPPSTTLLLYTDGLVERRGQDLDIGMSLLARNLATLLERPLEELCDELLAAMLPDGTDDDVALVAVRLHDQGLPRPAEAGPEQVPEGLG